MFKTYKKWPEIAYNSFNSDLKEINFNNINHIVFAGMGGSGAIGDFFSSILSKTEIHTSVVKGYLLPKTVDENSLVVVTSVSGNTVETFEILKAAKKTDAKIITFSSNGIIENYSIKNQIDFRKIPQIHSPRASFAGYLYSMLKVLRPIIPLTSNDIMESIEILRKMREDISSSNLGHTNKSLELANWIKGIPLIYYPAGLQAAAIRFKNSLQENAKIHAIAEDVVEACHNGIVSWESNSTVQPILIEGKDDFYKTKERWKILKDYFIENRIDFKEVNSVRGNILSKLIGLIYELDYASYYKAIISNVDPSPVNSIEYIKKRTRVDL